MTTEQKRGMWIDPAPQTVPEVWARFFAVGYQPTASELRSWVNAMLGPFDIPAHFSQSCKGLSQLTT